MSTIPCSIFVLKSIGSNTTNSKSRRSFWSLGTGDFASSAAWPPCTLLAARRLLDAGRELKTKTRA